MSSVFISIPEKSENSKAENQNNELDDTNM